jgi:cytochrome c556
MTRVISPAENLINNFEGQKTSNNADHDRKLWTYEENRKFLEASQKFGLDYKKIQAYVRTRSVKQVKNKMLNLKATLREQISNNNLNLRKSSNDSLGSNNIIEMKKIPATK